MDVDKINLVNIFLVFTSLTLAYFIPFELFLYSYIILGPLHYLTEINWLYQKKFFLRNNNKWPLLLIIISVLIPIYIRYWGTTINRYQFTQSILQLMGTLSDHFILVGFLFIIGVVFFNRKKYLIIEFLIAFIITTYLLFNAPEWISLMGLFLPTLIHVYLFTLFFVLYGALKEKNNYGIYLAILLFLVPFIILYIPIDSNNYTPLDSTKDIFITNNLSSLAKITASIFNQPKNGSFYMLSEISIRIQIFIAFAYSYHYLNWFSKTSIIGWKKALSKKKSLWILLIWVLSISLYFYDFRTGLYTLFLLGYTHLIVEFPLNALSIKGVFTFIKSRK